MATIIKKGRGQTLDEPFDRHKLLSLLSSHSADLLIPAENISLVIKSIENGLPDSIYLDEFLQLVSETLAVHIVNHPDFSLLAGRIETVRIHTQCPPTFSENVSILYNNLHPKTKKPFPLISKQFYTVVSQNESFFNKMIKPERDYTLTYFGIKTLLKSYLLKSNTIHICETPQYLFLRVAIGINLGTSPLDLDSILETYELMSQKYFIHASPTLYNSGTPNNYLSSCFLLAMEDDSIDGIYKTLYNTALISKASGGIGLHVHNIRASGSIILTSNGTSSGLVPMLRVFNNTARYVDQGGNKRPGAFAIYLEPWHADIFEVLELRKNHGKEEMRARDLFYGLWVPDLFMERVKANGMWSLFSPDEAPGLSDVIGEDFKTLYESYESQNLQVKTIKAQKLWSAILEAQTETGLPYMLYKDACNIKSNQKNLGTIKSSNLCTEIIQYSSPQETAVCNLASLALPSFVNKSADKQYFDFKKLHKIAKILTSNLNKVIDVTDYPIAISKASNLKQRPIAIGVQGLADTFLQLRLPFDSPEAKTLNIQIFETIYHAALEASNELAIKHGSYETFSGSPASKGLLQFDLWKHKPSSFFNDWDSLKNNIVKHGLRNSLLVGPMPTASTSQILGFNECFEPFTSNLYTRRVLSGEFQIVNKYLVNDLIRLGLWSSAMKNALVKSHGSVQNIPIIPEELKSLYKTVWEISQKVIIDLAADRGKFIDQLQSMNIHLQNPTFGKLTSCHFYGWERGLKTGMYYLRTQAASRAIQFTVDEDDKLDENVQIDLSKLEKIPYLEIDGFESCEYSAARIRSKVDMELFDQSTTLSPADTDDDEEDRRIKRPIENEDEQVQKKLRSDSIYDIYDSTPVACDIENPENCEACSG